MSHPALTPSTSIAVESPPERDRPARPSDPSSVPEDGAPEGRAPARARGEGERAPAGGSDTSRGGSLLSKAILYSLYVPVAISLIGASYYILPLDERPWSPLHPWLRPAGYIGQSAGFLAFAMFLFLWLYPIRKKMTFLARAGSVAKWLDVHVVVGLAIPLVGAVHASWRFTGLIGMGYLAMVLVVISGIIGRYLYVRIPRTRNGLEMTREDAAAERRTLVGRIVETTGFSSERILELLRTTPSPAPGRKVPVVLLRMVADDHARRRAIHAFLEEWRRSNHGGAAPDRETLRRIARLARREMALTQQIRMLDGTIRVFRFWHAVHRPVAITAFLAVLVHVVVVIMLGATWIR